jgi:hypothetical protein
MKDQEGTDMFNKIGQPARHVNRVPRGNGALVTAGVAVIAVGVAFAIATPLSAAGAATHITLSSGQNRLTSDQASLHSGTPLLTAAGLHAVLGARFAPAGAAVTGQGATAAQQAVALLAGSSGTLSADGDVRTLQVPAIAGIAPAVVASLGPIASQLDAANGSDGEVAQAVNRSVLSISPLLDLSGPDATETATVPIDVDSAVAPDLAGATGAGAVTIDPQAGTVSVDLSRLVTEDGTSSPTSWGSPLSAAANAEIAADIQSALSALGTSVVNSATNSVEATPIAVNAHLSLLTHPYSHNSTACSSGSAGSLTSTTAPALGGLLGGLNTTVNNLLGGSIDSTVAGPVHRVLCSLPTGLLPSLPTTLSLNLGGTVGQIIEGTAPPASGTISVLGQPTAVNTSSISTGVGEALVNNFAGTANDGGTTGGATPSNGTGSATGPGTSACATGSATLALCLALGVNPGNDATGTGITAGILASLLGNGASADSTLAAPGSSAPGSLLNLRVGTGNGGLGAIVRVGAPSVGTGSATPSGSDLGNLLRVRVGSPTVPSSDNDGDTDLLGLGNFLGN